MAFIDCFQNPYPLHTITLSILNSLSKLNLHNCIRTLWY
jgi:hypothetical protein